MERYKRVKRYIIGLLAGLLLLAGAYIAMHLYTDKYNAEDRLLYYPVRHADSDISVNSASRYGSNTTWKKRVGDRQYEAHIYDVTVENISSHLLSDWKMSITMNEEAYINSAWCGTLIIHQSSSGKSQELDLREVSAADIKLDYEVVDGDILIPVQPGDTIEYIPSYSFYEYPLASRGTDFERHNRALVGIIMYFPAEVCENRAPMLSDISVYYHMQMDVQKSPAFWVVLVLAALWLMSAAVLFFTEVKTRKFEKVREHDELIISETMGIFTGFIDAKDPYTRGHSLRVAAYSRMMAERLSMSEAECENIYRVATLHDSGKIGIPDEILNKQGKLDDSEFELIKNHTIKGYDILLKMSSLPDAPLGARYHHERYDGTGYPDGLKGASIPVIARIISVADAFDAMNSDRCYRKKLSPDVIVSQLESNRGTQFDPYIVDAFLELISDGTVKF